jgi:hypothetical protein
MSDPDAARRSTEEMGVARSADRQELAKQLDDISLEQALVDVEIATARVSDLTTRLLSARKDLIAAQEEAAYLRLEVKDLEAQLDAMYRSRSYALAQKIARVRDLLR